MTPDGKRVLWFDESKIPGKNGAARLMRVPIEGGTPEVILTGDRTGALLCAKPQSRVCAIAERSKNHKEIVVTSLDPIRGREGELVRLKIEVTDDWASDISPDGTRLAAIIGAEDPYPYF